MMNKKLLSLTALAGLTLGGLTVASTASAQSYGGQTDAPAAEASAAPVETDAPETSRILEVQDAEEPGTDGEQPERRGRRGGCDLDEAAETIGIEEADLRAALESGDTIAGLAEANGVEVDVVIDAMADAKAERIADKVDEGRLTQEEADEKLADLESRISDRVNGVEEVVGA